MRERIALFLYLTLTVVLTLVHDPRLLGGGFLLALLAVSLLSGRSFRKVLGRAFFSVAFFTGAVSLAYLLRALYLGTPWREYLLMINLRVFTLALLTSLFVHRVNLVRALSFSPSLSYFLVIAYSQILAYGRMFREFRMALRSRSLEAPSLRDMLRFNGAMIQFFARRALHDSREIALAMRSRGCFHD